jgi:Ser/Thr protein kinase RdoA (MazF antagonist)
MVETDVDLGPWPGLEPVRVLAGGARNRVLLARDGDRRVVVRRSTRSSASLAWELDLLEHLAEQGVRVPRLIPTGDGRRSVDGVVVQEFLTGEPPRSTSDWLRVVAALAVVHEGTVGWPQRPGFASSAALLDRASGGDVRLDLMPPELVRQVRAAWAAVQVGPRSVVHGDVGAGNVLVEDGSVGFVDWDEARVDVRWFDLAAVPAPVPLPGSIGEQELAAAGVAWEAATCWVAEPGYARSCVSRLAAATRTGTVEPT